jgi:hypothetical protein
LTAVREPGAFSAWFRRIVFKHCDRLTRRKRPHGAYPNPPVESSADAVGIAIARGQSVHCCHAWTQPLEQVAQLIATAVNVTDDVEWPSFVLPVVPQRLTSDNGRVDFFPRLQHVDVTESFAP